MSYRRLFHWKCDLCGMEAPPQERYGTPAGWAWFRVRGKTLEHTCGFCPIPIGAMTEKGIRKAPHIETSPIDGKGDA